VALAAGWQVSTFKGRYTVADGYVNQNGRPHHFKINASDLEDDMTDDQLREFYEETACDHFAENITCEPDYADNFVEWARERLLERGK
jgi:hypothetical protein